MRPGCWLQLASFTEPEEAIPDPEAGRTRGPCRAVPPGDTYDDHDYGGASGNYWVEAAKHPTTQKTAPHPQNGPASGVAGGTGGLGDWTLTRPWPGLALGRQISGAIQGASEPHHHEQKGGRSRGLPAGAGDRRADHEMPAEPANPAAEPGLQRLEAVLT